VENGASPLVTIGLPVYNGASRVARALESLLAQDYANLEIVVSDNGSTDGTQLICEDFSRRDGRIRYHRSGRNMGWSWNFNRVFELGKGEYFMWAAHDDIRHPTFVSACVRRLQECPTAVLCQAHTAMFIEGRDEQLCTAHLNTFEGITGTVARYRETLKRFPATAIYGLYRSSAVRKTKLFQRHIATDLAFIQELSIHGDFVQVPAVLFTYVGRQHWNTVDQDYRAMHGGATKPRWYLPFVVLFMSHWRRLSSSSIDRQTKVRLFMVLLWHEVQRLTMNSALKTVGRLCPRERREDVGAALYYRWMQCANVAVCSRELYLERVIKPALGWWRRDQIAGARRPTATQ
jgi:glycosyltransferase involved in cell wall biosynthesis